MVDSLVSEWSVSDISSVVVAFLLRVVFDTRKWETLENIIWVCKFFFSAFKVVLMFQFFLFTCKARIVIDSKFEECVIWQKKI